MRLFLASTLAQGRKVFRDTFNRADVSGIGRASDGSAWNTIRGSWSILGNKARGADANYPLISQNMLVSNNEIGLYGTSTGSAAALWVTDSGNWWAVGLVQEPTDCNCTYYYNTYYYYSTSNNCVGYNASNQNATNCIGGYTPGSCNQIVATCNGGYNAPYSYCNNYAYNNSNKTTRCSGSFVNVASSCAGSNYSCDPNSPYNAATCDQGFNAQYYNGSNAYTYSCSVQTSGQDGPYASCQTCYPQYVRVLQSAANTVSTITQWSLSSIASALKVKTSGSQITVSAYSDSSMVTQIGSNLVYTPTGVTLTPTFGLTIIPSSYNQGYTTDEIQIKRS